MTDHSSLLGKSLLILAIAFLAHCSEAEQDRAAPSFQHSIASGGKPWSHEHFDDAQGKFTFAIFSDLNGGERRGVFEIAMAQLSLLHPEFILSVGDLIDGANLDPSALKKEWDDFDFRVSQTTAPVFYVGGNHNLTGQALREVWAERYGPLYYHFVYKNSLFLVLDTEDHAKERMEEIYQARAAAIAVLDGDHPEKAQEMEYYRMPERVTGAIGPEQSSYFQQVIVDHPDVQWILLFMHKPVWQSEDEPDFAKIESALADRPYTLFNGHFHAYSHTVRKGRDYFMLGTTGGGQSPDQEMAFDHVTLVTMTPDGPSIAHLKLEGILDKTGHIPLRGDTLCFQASRCEPEDSEPH